MANVVQIESQLRSLSDEQLGNELQQPSGTAPPYLVLTELQRRKDMRKAYEGERARYEQSQPTVAEELARGAGRGGGNGAVAPRAGLGAVGGQRFQEGGMVEAGGVADLVAPEGAGADPIDAYYRMLLGEGNREPDYMTTLRKQLAGMEEGAERKRDRALGSALMRAGLSMAASKERGALSAIAEGGIAGLDAYRSDMEAIQDAEKERLTLQGRIEQAAEAQRMARIQTGIEWKKHQTEAAAEKQEADAPFILAALDEATDQASYDAGLTALRERGVDVSRLPKRYSPEAMERLKGGYRIALDETQTERDKLREDLRKQGHSEPEIREMMTNRDRFQFSQDQFGNVVVFDRYKGGPVSQAQGTVPVEEPLEGTGGMPTLEPGFEVGVGARGFLGNIVNTITDAVGAGLAFENVAQSKIALNNLQGRTMLELASMMPGRESNLVRERLESYAVTPTSLFEGDESALLKLTQTRNYIDELLGRAQDKVDNPSAHPPKEVAAARDNMASVESLRNAYNHIISNWQGVPQVMSKEAYDKLPSGTRFRDPQGTTRVKP